MSNYTKQISWSGKDALSDSDPEKVISGGDFDTEFSAVQTAINSKIDGGTITNFTSTGIDDNATSTAITIDSAEHVSLAHGIGFNGDTAAANTLDDYEEGTFTPTFAFGGASVGMTFDDRSATYTKIGNIVTVQILIDLSLKGSSTGTATIAGLPFTCSGRAAPSFTYLNDITFADFIHGQAEGGTVITLQETTNAGARSLLNETNFTNNSRIVATMVYKT